MDNFHLIEVIRRGKYSTVYKGRKKEHYKKIYAIKSVDKSHKNTVLQEVRILQCLDHSNVVKFYDWYETSAYSRLILEYCGGGDLHTLLELESKLPEDSVCDIARDIVTALRYLHSKGIIHGNLKPSNILFDVNGCTKLCDFGLSKELSDISKTPSSLEEGEGNKRGSPCYMAPELFKDGGVHSYASDLWALGCVLYECYAGRPPFIGTEFTQIVKSILTDPTPPLSGNPSRPFANLVTRLLNKDPTLRIRWSEIRTHAFWKSHPLPPEPPFFNQNQNPNIPNIVENIEIENGDTELEVNENLSEVLWHESDLMVQPVIPSPSPKSEEHRLHILGSLSFGAVSSSDVLESPKDHLEGVTELIATILNKNYKTIGEEQKNVIRFLELLSTDVTAANILSNSLIMPILVKMLQESKTCGLRVQLAALLGRIIRHSTLFNVDLADSGIFDALNEGLIYFRQKKVRRFSMAALGELLFHISGDSKATSTSETPCQVPNTSISLVTSLLRKEEDDKTQLYALRTIENMTSVGKYWATLFTTQDVINNLCDIFQSSNKQEPTRMAAGSCLVRLVRFTPPTIQQLMEKLTFKELAISISKQNPSQKQQICLNLLNMALIDRNFFPDIEHKNLVPNIAFLVTHGGEVLGGKSLLFITLLCRTQARMRWLGQFFLEGLLLSNVDTLVGNVKNEEERVYLQKCLEVWLGGVARLIPRLMASVICDVRQRIQGESTLETNYLQLFPVVDRFLIRPAFRSKLLDDELIQQLMFLIELIESPFQGRDDFERTLVGILETIAYEESFMEQNRSIVLHKILPSVSMICGRNKDGETRFTCLRIWFLVVVNMTDESAPLYEEELRPVCNDHFLPLYPQLLEMKDVEQIPIYAEKLLYRMAVADIA